MHDVGTILRLPPQCPLFKGLAVADLTFEVVRIPDIENAARVSLSGAIDASTVITFQTELDKLKKNGVRRFLLDMAGIRYVNSTGLGSLVKLADGLENEGGLITLMQIHPKVKVVFDMLGLNAFFKIFKTDGEALQFIRESMTPAAEPIEEVAPIAAEEPVARPAPAAPAAPAPAPRREPEQPERAAPVLQARPAAAEEKTAASYPAPLIAACAECGIGIRIPGAGSYRCPRCFTVLHASPSQKVEFGDRRREIPLQVTLTGDEAFIKGLASCVVTLARLKGFGDAKAKEIGTAVETTCRNLRSIAYDGDGRMSYGVLIEAVDGQMVVRFADHGKKVDLDSAAFEPVRSAVTDISHVPHPKGGNILRIVKNA